LLDDNALQAMRIGSIPNPSPPPPMEIQRWFAIAVAILLFLLSGFQFLRLFGVPTPGAVATVMQWVAPFGIVNQYGPFAVMTTTRPEIIVEGSNDGETWLEYEFKFKPGDVRRAPPWVEPHQPRLDWQMWFAALGARTSDPNSLLPSVRSNRALMFRLLDSGADAWVVNFAVRLLEGSPPVLALLDKNPFPDAPPRFIRARLYEYRFADVDAPLTRGAWWVRADRGIYLSPLTLGGE
jgi:lipase maturation factor 1